ncbi:MAG TPA: lytic transglycosylase domain-containing protein [Acidimicrobiales bacterium]|nr:lytic transglycosylase domain-containing protein [Acidimicrobiales bacterium]
MIGKAVMGAVAVGPVAAVVLVGSLLAAAGGPAAGGGGGGGGEGAAGFALSGGAAGVDAGAAGAAEIPSGMLELYRAAAATCPGLAWEVLAGIGRVETDHGRNVAVSSAGAEGPMQFMPATWAEYGVDVRGTGAPDVNDPADAVYAAARMLCADGAASLTGVPGAVFAYNHSLGYVSDVLGWAAAYASAYREG